MAHVLFNTLQFVETLTAADIPKNQAIALCYAINTALIEALYGKTDLSSKLKPQQKTSSSD